MKIPEDSELRFGPNMQIYAKKGAIWSFVCYFQHNQRPGAAESLMQIVPKQPSTPAEEEEKISPFVTLKMGAFMDLLNKQWEFEQRSIAKEADAFVRSIR